jgi:hypothetical protein
MNMATIQPLSYSGYRFRAVIISHCPRTTRQAMTNAPGFVAGRVVVSAARRANSDR